MEQSRYTIINEGGITGSITLLAAQEKWKVAPGFLFAPNHMLAGEEANVRKHLTECGEDPVAGLRGAYTSKMAEEELHEILERSGALSSRSVFEELLSLRSAKMVVYGGPGDAEEDLIQTDDLIDLKEDVGTGEQSAESEDSERKVTAESEVSSRAKGTLRPGAERVSGVGGPGVERVSGVVRGPGAEGEPGVEGGPGVVRVPDYENMPLAPERKRQGHCIYSTRRISARIGTLGSVGVR